MQHPTDNVQTTCDQPATADERTGLARAQLRLELCYPRGLRLADTAQLSACLAGVLCTEPHSMSTHTPSTASVCKGKVGKTMLESAGHTRPLQPQLGYLRCLRGDRRIQKRDNGLERGHRALLSGTGRRGCQQVRPGFQGQLCKNAGATGGLPAGPSLATLDTVACASLMRKPWALCLDRCGSSVACGIAANVGAAKHSAERTRQPKPRLEYRAAVSRQALCDAEKRTRLRGQSRLVPTPCPAGPFPVPNRLSAAR
jgi:hypothetical protein